MFMFRFSVYSAFATSVNKGPDCYAKQQIFFFCVCGLWQFSKLVLFVCPLVDFVACVQCGKRYCQKVVYLMLRTVTLFGFSSVH